MALETVVYPQDPFGYGYKEFQLLNSGSSVWGGYNDLEIQEEENKAFVMNNGNNWDTSSSSVIQNVQEYWDPNSSPEDCGGGQLGSPPAKVQAAPAAAAVSGRRKRRRTKSCKNKEELENQRMTHIAVERNRRKQMNEYLGVIRALMPDSYVQRGDQASIIGGAINYVKELEHLLQRFEAQKKTTLQHHGHPNPNPNPNPNNDSSPLFADFFSFPQYYSTRSAQADEPSRCGLADIEVTMAESHASVKVLAKKRPKQLIKMVAGLQCLRLTILHLNVTTVDHMVLYSLSVKIEDGCQLSTVDEIAETVNQLLGRIEQEAVLIS